MFKHNMKILYQARKLITDKRNAMNQEKKEILQ